MSAAMATVFSSGLTGAAIFVPHSGTGCYHAPAQYNSNAYLLGTSHRSLLSLCGGDQMKMLALVTNQGTAASETALCEQCFENDAAVLRIGTPKDVPVRQWVDCTGNEYLSCNSCGMRVVR
jgi:hypothetical protein